MTDLRPSARPAVGSTQWLQEETEQMTAFEAQEIEDFAYSTRNELDWLNEHMADLFSHTELNVADVFKTPGKLRGKTPRTVRTQTLNPTRLPLTEVFAADVRFNRSPTRPSSTATAKAVQPNTADSPPKLTQQDNTLLPSVESERPEAILTEDTQPSPHATKDVSIDDERTPLATRPTEAASKTSLTSDEARTADNSFHSARETTAELRQSPERHVVAPRQESPLRMETNAYPSISSDGKIVQPQSEADSEGRKLETSPASSRSSSPAKGLIRKSSFAFASLPAPEPLRARKSIEPQGSRASQTDVRRHASLARASVMNRFTAGTSISGLTKTANQVGDVDEGATELPMPDSPNLQDKATKLLHSKSSTQRLHERITLLGKTQAPRPTKSIPATQAVAYPDLPAIASGDDAPQTVDTGNPESNQHARADTDDWIAPPAKSNVHQPESTRTQSEMADRQQISHQMGPKPARQETSSAQAVAPVLQSQNVDNVEIDQSTTPAGSPMSKAPVDGHLNASKLRLQSIMETARGLFSSSTQISTQAKFETMSSSTDHPHHLSQDAPAEANAEPNGATHSKEAVAESEPPTAGTEQQPAPVARRTRSSTEKPAQAEGMSKPMPAATKSRSTTQEDVRRPITTETTAEVAPAPQTANKAAGPLRRSPRRPQEQTQRPTPAEETKPDLPAPSTHGTQQRPPSSHAPKLKDVKRPLKPSRDAVAKSKPQPVSIRVGTLSQRLPLAASSLASSVHEPHVSNPVKSVKATGPTAQTVAPKPALSRSISNSSTKPKALLAAERKREQDEREAQRKLEQKRALERKRAAIQEEARKKELQQRQEEQQQQQQQARREQERAAPSSKDDSKRLAQKQAIEKRRLELSKREKQPAGPRVAPVAPEHTAPATQRTSHLTKISRPEAVARPPSRSERPTEQVRHPVSTSTAMPAKVKRTLDTDHDDELARPVQKGSSANYQIYDSKRRRTSEEPVEVPAPVRPTMAPPIRHSNIRKDLSKPSLLNSIYPTAPAPAAVHAASIKPAPVQQIYQQQSFHSQSGRAGHPADMARFTNGKIPFAKTSNPQAAAAAPTSAAPTLAGPSAAVAATYKTPLVSKAATHLTAPPSKSSPMYPHGEHIHLEEIHTSEDEDDDADSSDERDRKASLPDWVRTPNMLELLRQQETVNADAVFGPIAPANVEEWFTKDKNRLHRLRARTSSANWFGSDRLTEEEIRHDMTAREKMSRDGGWSYGI